MPHSPVYNNAWLAARANRPTTITRDIMHSPEEQARRKVLVDGPTFDVDPVEDARRYLESAPDYSDIASIPERLKELQSGPRPSLRGLTEPLARAGQYAMTASLPTAFVPGGQAVAAGMGLGGTVAQVPDMIARSLDDDPTNDPGVLEGGFAALGLLPGVGAARAARRAIPPAGMPSRVLGAPASTEIPFASAQRAINPNQVLRTARDVADESGEPLSKVIRGKGGKTGYSKPQTEALMRLASSGMVSRVSREADEALAEAATIARQRRNIPLTAEQVAESPLPTSEDAWSALRTLARRREGGSPPSWGSTQDIALGPRPGGRPYSRRPLTTAQERAQERFGRVYRSETGGPGSRTPEPEVAELSRFPVERLPKGGSTKERAKIVREREAKKTSKAAETDLNPYLRAEDYVRQLRESLAKGRARRTGQPLAEEF